MHFMHVLYSQILDTKNVFRIWITHQNHRRSIKNMLLNNKPQQFILYSVKLETHFLTCKHRHTHNIEQIYRWSEKCVCVHVNRGRVDHLGTPNLVTSGCRLELQAVSEKDPLLNFTFYPQYLNFHYFLINIDIKIIYFQFDEQSNN